MEFIMKKENLINYVIIGLLIITAALMRVLPHPENVVPITAIALFSGAFIARRAAAIAVSLSVMFISDLFIGLEFISVVVYFCIALTVLIGAVIKQKTSFINVVAAVIASSMSFFIITNFTVWFFWSMYPKNIEGLLNCYIMALPFFRNSLAGDLFYTGVMFSVYKFASYRINSYMFKPQS